MSSTAIPELEAGPSKAPAGHPRGLYVLFGAEMWERFSYYGMRSLLVLYLVNYLKWDRPDALGLYATYTGLVYLTPLLGGFLADRYLGQRKAILIGGVIIALGHFALAINSLMYPALGLIILGTGFFKPNISTMVGQLYPQGDPRRDVGYTIFYMGINLGAGLAPFVCGTLGEKVGWHYGFAAAGVGMILGLINFAAYQRTLGQIGMAPGSEGDEPRIRGIDWIDVIVQSIAGVAAVVAAVFPAEWIYRLAPGKLGTAAVLAYWFALCLVLVGVVAVTRKLFRRTNHAVEVTGNGDLESGDADRNAPFTSADWQRITVIFVVAIFSILFWMGFEQAGGTLNLFADKHTNRVVLNYEFPASWYQAVNAWLIIALAPVFSLLWMVLDRTPFRLNSAAKMGLGLTLLGVSFGIMFNADKLAGANGRVGPHWLAIVYLFNTLGELCLSPIGLSLVNKLAPARIASLMMAIWFLCTAIANYLAGILEHQLQHWNINLWTFLIFTSVAPGLLLLALSPLLKKMSHGRL